MSSTSTTVIAASVAAAKPTLWQDVEKEVTIGFDMLKNFNFSQVADVATALKGGGTGAVTAVETVANAIVSAGAVAGNPIAIEAAAVLPIAEKLLEFLPGFTALFGGTTSSAAATATAISSPSTLTPQVLTGVGHRTGIN